jgi:hypothetical protein
MDPWGAPSTNPVLDIMRGRRNVSLSLVTCNRVRGHWPQSPFFGQSAGHTSLEFSPTRVCHILMRLDIACFVWNAKPTLQMPKKQLLLTHANKHAQKTPAPTHTKCLSKSKQTKQLLFQLSNTVYMCRVSMLIFCVLFLLFYILFVLVEDNRDEGGVVFYPADSVHAILKVQCH